MTKQIMNFKDDLKHIELKGKPMNDRLAETLDILKSKPGESISGASGSACKAKNIYRMLVNDNFDIDKVKVGHYRATAERINNSESDIVLAVQDTTSVNYNTHTTPDLGYFCD